MCGEKSKPLPLVQVLVKNRVRLSMWLCVPLPGATAGAVPVGKNAANPKNFVKGQYCTPDKQCVQTNYRRNAEITG